MTSALIILMLLLFGVAAAYALWERRKRKFAYHERHRDSHGIPRRWEASPAAINDYKEAERLWHLPPSTTDN